MRAFLLPRLRDVMFIAFFIGVIGLGSRLLNIDGDLGRHLTIGEYILQDWEIPTRDIFSHTMAGAPLTPHEWLAEVFFTLAYRVGGLNGVVFLCATLIAVTFTLVFQSCFSRSNLLLASMGWTTLAAAAASLHWLARPHLFTLLLVIVWTGLLERIRRGGRVHWWIFPILMLFWANLHGAFIAAFVIWGCYLAGEIWEWGTSGLGNVWEDGEKKVRRQKLRLHLGIGLSSFLATLVNPAGWHLWQTSLGYLGNRYLVSHTAEYFSPNFQQSAAWPFLLFIGISIGLLASGKVKLPVASALLLVGWTVMGLYSVRNVPLYALLAAPILAEGIAASANQLATCRLYWKFEARLAAVEGSLCGFLWPMLVVLAVAAGLASGARFDFAGQGNWFDPAVFPVRAMDWIQSQSRQRVFNYFPWGGYMLYRAWPEQRVFIDGQTDFYGETLTRQYEQVISLSEGWQEVLRQYQVDWVLMPVGSRLVRALGADPAWRLVYEDETAAILFLEP